MFDGQFKTVKHYLIVQLAKKEIAYQMVPERRT